MVKPGLREGYPLAAHSLRRLSPTAPCHGPGRIGSQDRPEVGGPSAEYELERGGIRVEKRPYRRFTHDEDAQIEALRLQGLGFKKIGRLLHRPRSSVQFRLRLLAEVAELRLLMEVTNNACRGDQC